MCEIIDWCSEFGGSGTILAAYLVRKCLCDIESTSLLVPLWMCQC